MDTIKKKIEAFFQNFKQQTFKQGSVLIRADESPTGVYFLKKGRVKQYAISKKGEELIVNIFKENSFFPISWALNNTTNTYYYEAETEVLISKADKEKVLEFLKKNNDVLLDLLSRVYRGVDGVISRMVYLMSENAYDRVIVELIIHARRFGKKIGTIVEIETSEKEIAARSGMTRETISREIKKLKDRGLVTFQKNILKIQDMKKLEEELNSGL